LASPELAALVTALRSGAMDFTAAPVKVRADFSAMTRSAPLPADVHVETIQLAGLHALATTTPGADPGRTLLYLHGGAYVIGSARDYLTLSAALGRAAAVRAVAIDYRLAPEHPYPAAVDDALAAYQALLVGGVAAESIVIAGDSAGGGLAVALLLAARAARLPMPAGALLLSPWVDMACDSDTMRTRAAQDPALDQAGLMAMAAHYLNGRAADSPLASPIHADLVGLPPLMIQVGSSEVLLDDALRLAKRAAAADVRVTLAVWPEMVHVWHFFAFMLPEGKAALAEAGGFLTAQLNSHQP
jgi:monoterpene epsilon-lactone hydrolase